MIVWYSRAMTVIAAGALIALIVATSLASHWHRTAEDAARQVRIFEDEAAFRDAHATVATPDPHPERSLSAPVRTQVANVQRAVPSARVVAAGQFATGPIAAPPVDPKRQPETAPTDDCVAHWSDGIKIECEVAEVRAESGAAAVVGEARLLAGGGIVAIAPFDSKASRWIVSDADLPRAKSAPKWAVTGGYGLAAHGRMWDAGVERRLLGPVWAGVAVGSFGGDSFVMGRVRVEF